MLNVGMPVTKQTIDAFFGNLAIRLAQVMDDAERASSWLAAVTDFDLEGLGYTVGDVTALRDAGYAYGVVAQVYSGQVAVDPATDFRVSIRKLSGLG